jgi:hypothetical protein
LTKRIKAEQDSEQDQAPAHRLVCPKQQIVIAHDHRREDRDHEAIADEAGEDDRIQRQQPLQAHRTCRRQSHLSPVHWASSLLRILFSCHKIPLRISPASNPTFLAN